MQVYLIRHGETIWNKDGRYQGTRDIPLSEEGIRKLKKADLSPEEVYVTPLQRTRQTAKILFPDAKQVVIDGLKEMNFGDFEGRSYREMEHDDAYRSWVDSMCLSDVPNGEGRKEFADRIETAFAEVMRCEAAKGNEKVFIVAHGGTQMALLERFGLPPKEYWDWLTPNGCGYLINADNWEEKRELRIEEKISFACSE